MNTRLIIMILLAVGIGTTLPTAPVFAQSGTIKIDKTMDPDSQYVMLSDTAVGKYRYGKSKWFNWEDEKQKIVNQAAFNDTLEGVDRVYIKSPDDVTIEGTNVDINTPDLQFNGLEEDLYGNGNSRLVYNRNNGRVYWDSTSTTGGTSLPYYEAFFRIKIGEVSSDTATIINTFPGTWDMSSLVGAGRNGYLYGWQINYSGCGEDGVDCSGNGTKRLLYGDSNGQTFCFSNGSTACINVTQYMNGNSVGFFPMKFDGYPVSMDEIKADMTIGLHIVYYK